MNKEINALTGLYFNNNFFEVAEEFLQTVNPMDYCVMAVDVEHFRLYNKIHGRADGDRMLKMIANILKQFQEIHGGVVGYLGGDNFGILTYYDKDVLGQLRHDIRSAIRVQNNTAGYRPAFGIYHIVEVDIPVATMYDHATVALSHVIGNYTTRSCEYYPDMDGKVEEEIRLLSDIQKGMENDEFTFFIQPQCDIDKTKIVGGESLVRWIKEDGSMVPPGVFIPVLEKNGFVADLDVVVWDKVCKWLRACIDKGYKPVPISINVSRIDIFSMNVPEYLESLMEKYELDENLLKVEITESAYAESSDKIIRTVRELQEDGFIVMMDDFGSGYSSLNMLKSVPVDVLKMDMRFLEIGESEEEKGVGILESVINMARQMKVPVVVEGVEFKKHEVLLQRMGCRYTQGYYYYKPMSIEAFEELLADERNIDYEGFWCKQSESIHIRELMDANLFSDTVVNNILGAIAFYDIYENNIEITRANEQYLQLIGEARKDEDGFRKRFWTRVRDDDRQLLFSIFNEAYENQAEGATGYVHVVRDDSSVVWVHIRVFFLREKNGHKMFCATLTDMTELKDKKNKVINVGDQIDDLTETQIQQLAMAYDNLPAGYGIGRLKMDEQGNPIDYEIIYANKNLSKLSGGDGFRLRYLMSKIFVDNKEELIEKAYRAGYLGETVGIRMYSKLSGRYLDMTFYQYQYGYIGCLVQDATSSRVYEKSMNCIMSTFREVFFVHIQDNYCRMIYPDENHLLDRGIYEEVVNRHFEFGKILNYDEENVRKFLSLENLKKVLEKQDSVELKYKRKIEPAGEEWCLTTFMVAERENGVPKTAIATVRSIEALMREQYDSKHRSMAVTLAHMSDGFFVYRAMDDEKILYANPAVLKIYGCETMDEFRELVDNSFMGMVHPDDLKRVQWEIEQQVVNSDRKLDFIYYRIIAKDGTVRWIDDCGHLEDTDSGDDAKLFYVFISDITDTIDEARIQKIMQKNKRFNEE